MAISHRTLTSEQIQDFQTREESQWFDRKSKRIAAAKLAQSFSAFANADGGDLVVGIEDDGQWDGYPNIESTNDIVAQATKIMNSEYFSLEIAEHPGGLGHALVFTIQRHPEIVKTTKDEVYLRVSAQNLKQEGEALQSLIRSRGTRTFESTPVDEDAGELLASEVMADFLRGNSYVTEPKSFLKKNKLVRGERATVAGLLLFSDLPQATLPCSAVKLYRYRTQGDASREFLDAHPETLEGPLTQLLVDAKSRIEKIVSNIPRLGPTGLARVSYPPEAVHEVLTNALLHRDYGHSDYVHVKIFDNRIEVESPGRLHGQVTIQNIMETRSARNPLLQRVINRFPDPPNKDIGEGLNTAFQEAEKLRLRTPIIQELDDRIRVTVFHEPLASPQETIMDFVLAHGSINNSQAREATKIAQERDIRRIFAQLMKAGELRREGTGRGTRYTAGRVKAEGSGSSAERLC